MLIHITSNIKKWLHRLNIIKNLARIESHNREILMAQIFTSSIVDVEWLKRKSFSPSGSAANYSLLYFISRAQ
jgi:abortive infection bacteriophage resistance protein